MNPRASLFPNPPAGYRLAVSAAFIFIFFLVFHLRDNVFPHFYHTDEPSKVEQILTGSRNGRHPALLLSSAAGILKIGGWTPTRDHAARAGRIASGIFAAAAIALLFLWACQQAGWAAGWLAAIFAGLQPILLTASHFVKEDPALLLGLAATVLTMSLYSEKPGAARAFWLGLAGGLALSGKWIGVVALLVGLLQLWLVRSRSPIPAGKLLLAFFGGTILIFLITNWQMVAQWNVVEGGLKSEVTSFYATDQGQDRAFNGWHYARRLPEVFAWPLLIAALAGWWRIFRQKESSSHLRLVALLPIGWLLMISLIPKTENRYLIPVIFFTSAVAALAVADWLRWLARWKIPLFASLLALGFFVCQWTIPQYREAVDSFQHDHRREMAGWIEKHLSSSAILVEDSKVGLPLAGDPRFEAADELLRQKTFLPLRNYVSDHGTLAGLRAAGVTHVAIFPSNYLILLERSGQKADTAQKRRAAEFYRTLRQECRRVFSRKKGFDRYLNPAVALYEIGPNP